MKRILRAIKETFPEFEENKFSEGLTLGSIADFDSMNAINLQINLQAKFGIKFYDFSLKESTSIAEIANFLRNSKIDLKDL